MTENHQQLIKIITAEATGRNEILWGMLRYCLKDSLKQSSKEHKNLMDEDKAIQKQKEPSELRKPEKSAP